MMVFIVVVVRILSPHKQNENVVKVGHPLTKISGSAHGIALHIQVILKHNTKELTIESLRLHEYENDY